VTTLLFSECDEGGMTAEDNIDAARLANIIDMLARVTKTRMPHIIAGAARVAVADFAASMAWPSTRRMLFLLDAVEVEATEADATGAVAAAVDAFRDALGDVA
jgi:hypothetical protein